MPQTVGGPRFESGLRHCNGESMATDTTETPPEGIKVGVKQALETLDGEHRRRIFKFALRARPVTSARVLPSPPFLPGRASRRAPALHACLEEATFSHRRQDTDPACYSWCRGNHWWGNARRWFGSAPFTAGLGTAAATGIALGITVAGAVATKLTTIALDPVVRKARNFAAIYRRAAKRNGDLDGRNPEPCHRGDGLALIAQGAGRSH